MSLVAKYFEYFRYILQTLLEHKGHIEDFPLNITKSTSTQILPAIENRHEGTWWCQYKSGYLKKMYALTTLFFGILIK